ncbi:unnamed protein product [Vicia faba]|uniref:Uncharacterized protein n=1 Tax=Vicia faba TaxID=3906 RepID=A0AAV1ANQ2_VICFA|nr:unnamed protein product [Vicia faba]
MNISIANSAYLPSFFVNPPYISAVQLYCHRVRFSKHHIQPLSVTVPEPSPSSLRLCFDFHRVVYAQLKQSHSFRSTNLSHGEALQLKSFGTRPNRSCQRINRSLQPLPDLQILFASRNRGKGEALVAKLSGNSGFAHVDSDDPDSLETALKGVDLVVHYVGPFQKTKNVVCLKLPLIPRRNILIFVLIQQHYGA